MTNCPSCQEELPPEVRFCPHCGARLHEPPPSGDPMLGKTLNEKYRIHSKIGDGSMGTVYLAEHIGLKKKVALKVLHPNLHLGEEELQRFQREGIAAGKFNHPNAIQIFDFDRAELQIFYLAMEFVEGDTLGEYLSQAGRLSSRKAVAIVRQALGALAEAHRHGIVHRDLKPENIMVVRGTSGGLTVKVLDFGMSKLIDRPLESSLQTQPGRILGTPLYMAPEQAAGGEVDHRSDLYSMGLILYELLTGKRPYTGSSLTEIFLKKASEPVPSITDSFPELRVPGGLDDIIAQACEKRPEDRFQSATEMLEALDSLASGTRPRAVRKRTTQVRQPVVDPDDEDEDDDEEEEYEEEGGFLARLPVSARIVAGVVLLVAVAGGVWIFGVGGGGPGSAPRLSMLSPGDRTEEQTKYVGLLDDARRSLLSGDTELALGSVETAQQMEVRDSEALLVRAMIYRQMQDHDMALADYRDALSLDPGYAAAAAGLGWVELERGRLDEALASFEQAGKLDSRSGEALAGQGAVAFLRGDRERAGELLSEAVELAGDFAPAHEWMGRVHLAVGDHAGAVAAFVQAKRCDPRSWRAYTGLGEAYLGQGRTDEAEKQLRGALNLAPGAEEPLTTLAAMLIESERYAETINLLTSSAHAGSHALDVLEGAALQGAGRRQDAIAVLERATSGAEVDAQAETLLGILYQQDGDHASAIDRYRRAAAADETLSLPHLNMGLALFALERYEESADELTTAVQLDANSTFAHYGLGILQMDYLGDTERAIFHLEAYIELGGPDDRVGDWVARLRSL